jgi:hypothetical protein
MATKSKAAPVANTNTRIEANRKRRLERTVKAHPNNQQAALALKESRGHKRKKPASPYWSHTMIREAKLFKEFTGRIDLNIFHSIESTRGNARLHLSRSDWSQVTQPEGKVSFALAARAHDKQGRLVWA